MEDKIMLKAVIDIRTTAAFAIFAGDPDTSFASVYENEYLRIDWGDGTVDRGKIMNAFSLTASPTDSKKFGQHSYSESGIYTIIVYGSGARLPVSDGTQDFELFYSTTGSIRYLYFLYVDQDFIAGNSETDPLDIRLGWSGSVASGTMLTDIIGIDHRNLYINGLKNAFIRLNPKVSLDNVAFEREMHPSAEYYMTRDILGNGTQKNKMYTDEFPGIFSPVGSRNGIAPKLNGAMIAATELGSTTTYTYTTHPNLAVKNVLINAPATSNQSTVFAFDPKTFTISVIAYDGDEEQGSTTESTYISFKIIYEDDSFDTDYFISRRKIYAPCLALGTKIMLWNGSEKKIEDIEYSDLLKVYNPFTGKIEPQHPFFIKAIHPAPRYILATLEDKTEIKIIGEHNFYNYCIGKFISINEKNFNLINPKEFSFMKIDENDKLSEVFLEKLELINEEVEFSTILTSGCQVYFSNGVLSGSDYYTVIGDMKEHRLDTSRVEFVRNSDYYVSYGEFCKKYAPIPRYLYKSSLIDAVATGLKLGMDKELDTSKYSGNFKEDFVNGIKYFWNDRKPYPLDNGFTVLFISLMKKDGSIETIRSNEFSSLNLPEGRWYSIGDHEIYENNYSVVMNTVLKEI